MILFETMTNKDNIKHLTCVMIYIFTMYITVVLKHFTFLGWQHDNTIATGSMIMKKFRLNTSTKLTVQQEFQLVCFSDEKFFFQIGFHHLRWFQSYSNYGYYLAGDLGFAAMSFLILLGSLVDINIVLVAKLINRPLAFSIILACLIVFIKTILLCETSSLHTWLL